MVPKEPKDQKEEREKAKGKEKDPKEGATNVEETTSYGIARSGQPNSNRKAKANPTGTPQSRRDTGDRTIQVSSKPNGTSGDPEDTEKEALEIKEKEKASVKDTKTEEAAWDKYKLYNSNYHHSQQWEWRHKMQDGRHTKEGGNSRKGWNQGSGLLASCIKKKKDEEFEEPKGRRKYRKTREFDESVHTGATHSKMRRVRCTRSARRRWG